MNIEQIDKFVCPDCNQEFLFDCESENVTGVCADCADSNYYQCNNCKCYVSNDEMTELEEGFYYCNDCFNDNFSYCEDCNRRVQNNELCSINSGIRYVCENCYSESYSCCMRCGYSYHLDDLGENGVCIECCNENSSLYEYNYVPQFEYYRLPNESRNTLYFGIELEVESDGIIDEYVDSMPDFVYCKSDGSLDSGFEIVSHPMTYNWIRANKNKWLNILKIRESGLKSYNTNTCGIHIHLTKSQFTTFQLHKWLLFFVQNPDFILKISQRKIENLNQWAALDDSKESIIYKAKTKQGLKKYEAINCLNGGTIEIRIFRGTLNTESFFKNIEFCQAMFEFTKNNSPDKMTSGDFINYIKENQKEFKNLLNFMKRRKICA